MPSISLGPEGCSEDNLVSDDDVCWQHGHASYRAQRPTRTQPSAMSAASSLDGTVARRAGRARGLPRDRGYRRKASELPSRPDPRAPPCLAMQQSRECALPKYE